MEEREKSGTLLRMKCTYFKIIYLFFLCPSTKVLYNALWLRNEAQGCKMLVHFLRSHNNHFPKTLEALSDDQGDRFPHDVSDIQR